MNIKIIYEDKTEEIALAKPEKLINLIKNDDRKYVCAIVNNRMRDLTFILNADSTVELLTTKDYDACGVMRATICYIVAMAIHNVLPKSKFTFSYSVSRSVFTSLSGIGHKVNSNDLKLIDDEVKRIIEADYPLEYKVSTKKEVLGMYKKEKQLDKLELYNDNDLITYYECNGYINYLHSHMAPSTGYVNLYKLVVYDPGFLILYPRSDLGGELPTIGNEDTFRTILKEAQKWSNTINAEYVYQINEIIDSKRTTQLINLCEAKHNRQFTHLGDTIEKNIKNIRMICVAGASSSGKTTFTNRVKVELISRGITPLMLSMDDFYKEGDYPKDEYGNNDYEHLNALDLELFDNTISRLLKGEAVGLPTFDFKSQTHTFSKPIKIDKKTPIIVEGIHGLNNTIAPSVPLNKRFRIYVAPLGQYALDSYSPLVASDLRLIRRMVRDNRTRGVGCEGTLKVWPSVRRGEFKWIYTCQNNADYIFNTELTYELPVLKKYALPLLEAITPESEYYRVAKRLIKFLKYYKSMDDTWVPCNSILREFIGGSIFYDTEEN